MEVPSSAVALGLNPGLAMAASAIGNVMVMVPCAMNGWLGARWGLNFPIIARSSFGMWGAYFACVVRAIVCVVWYGVQCSLGGNAVRCMVEAIWPSFKTWHQNSLLASADVTAPDLLCFVIFWLVSLPCLYLSIPTLRWVMLVKIVLMPFLWVALFTWAITASHGLGPLFSIPNKMTGDWTIAYAFFYTITASISGNATFAINMPDITRYARTPLSAYLPTVICLPICITLTELLGCVMAASAQVLYGTVLWNPLSVVTLWTNRPGKFFVGFLFAFANVATNVTGNSIPFANDVTNLLPRYLNIRRGQFLCAILGFAICPWLIQARAGRFLAFLNGYSVFMGPLLGVLISDYFIVRRMRGFNVYHLYKHHGLYWFTVGLNWRAFAAFVTGVAPLLPGLIHAINPSIGHIRKGILNFYSMSWFDGFMLAGIAYSLLCWVFPFSMETEDEDKAVHTIEGGEYGNAREHGTSLDGSTSPASSKHSSRRSEIVKDIEKE